MRWLFLLLVIAGLAFGGWRLTQPLAVLLHAVALGDVRATVSNTRVALLKRVRAPRCRPPHRAKWQFFQSTRAMPSSRGKS